MARFIVYCDGGFGNRYNALISGIAAAELLGYELEVIWPVNNWCEAEYTQLFGTFRVVKTSNLIDLKEHAHDWLVLSHDTINSEYLNVPYVSVYGFFTEKEFIDYCLIDGRDVFFYPAIFPQWISSEKLQRIAVSTVFHPDLVTSADSFIAENFPDAFYGIHLRRTDLILGYTDSEVGEIVASNADRYFFVCSDSVESESAAKLYPNVRVRCKSAYVERQEEGKGWSDVTLDSSNRAYNSNIRRNAQSVRDALIDLMILSRSSIVGSSGSTFLNVARYISGLSVQSAASLPPINIIPIEENFRKCAMGVLDISTAIMTSQQLWGAQQYERAVTLLRLWLKKPNSPQEYAVFFNLAIYVEQLGFMHEAECYMRHVIHLKPDFLQAYLQLGLLLEKMGRLEQTTAIWLHALSLPQEIIAHNPDCRNELKNNCRRLMVQECVNSQEMV